MSKNFRKTKSQLSKRNLIFKNLKPFKKTAFLLDKKRVQIGIVKPDTKIISSNLHVHIRSINITEEDGVFEGKISVSVKNKSQLDKIMDQLKHIDGIRKVSRTFAN